MNSNNNNTNTNNTGIEVFLQDLSQARSLTATQIVRGKLYYTHEHNIKVNITDLKITIERLIYF